MAYNETKPTDDEYIAAGPAAIRENFRALKEDQIVNAGKVNGLTVGNAGGDIPKANGVLCTNLNAQYLGGNLAGYFSPATHTHSAATTSSNGLMANTDKAKLDSIAAGAQVNQNAFASVLVGGTTIQADAATDTLELVAGSNILLTPSATNDRVTIEVTGTVPVATSAAVCTGNAATATALQTARTIGISGDATGVATSFNGSTNITIPVTLAISGVTAGTYSSVTVDAKGRVTGGTNPATISANTTGNAATATSAAACVGNAVTATKLQTPRTINGVVFDGSANVEISTANGGVIATTDQTNALAKSRMQMFTSSGTFIVPAADVYVTLSGAGGGGGSGFYSSGGAGGGCGQYKVRCKISGLIVGASIAVTVGTGGAGGAYPGNASPSSNALYAGTAGGGSSFGPYVTAVGGGGASWTSGRNSDGDFYDLFLGGTTAYPAITGGGSLSGSIGGGGAGGPAGGGCGGAGLLGACLTLGGAGGVNSTTAAGYPGSAGGLYGSGGGGGGTGRTAGSAGGAGANGFVLVEW